MSTTVEEATTKTVADDAVATPRNVPASLQRQLVGYETFFFFFNILIIVNSDEMYGCIIALVSCLY